MGSARDDCGSVDVRKAKLFSSYIFFPGISTDPWYAERGLAHSNIPRLVLQTIPIFDQLEEYKSTLASSSEPMPNLDPH